MSEQMTREELRVALLSALSGHSLVLSGWSVTDDVMEIVDDYIDQAQATIDQARAAIQRVRELAADCHRSGYRRHWDGCYQEHVACLAIHVMAATTAANKTLTKADQEQAADELSRLGQQQAGGPNPLVRGGETSDVVRAMADAYDEIQRQHRQWTCFPSLGEPCGLVNCQRCRETPIRVDHHACRIMWGPGCTSYHGGHECHHGDGHDGKHTCPCGATADNSAQAGGED